MNSPSKDRARKPGTTAERARRERWNYPAAARVIDPERGTVVVPCKSKFAAILCAAEVWRAEPGDQVETMPYII